MSWFLLYWFIPALVAVLFTAMTNYADFGPEMLGAQVDPETGDVVYTGKCLAIALVYALFGWLTIMLILIVVFSGHIERFFDLKLWKKKK